MTCKCLETRAEGPKKILEESNTERQIWESVERCKQHLAVSSQERHAQVNGKEHKWDNAKSEQQSDSTVPVSVGGGEIMLRKPKKLILRRKTKSEGLSLLYSTFKSSARKEGLSGLECMGKSSE